MCFYDINKKCNKTSLKVKFLNTVKREIKTWPSRLELACPCLIIDLLTLINQV